MSVVSKYPTGVFDTQMGLQEKNKPNRQIDATGTSSQGVYLLNSSLENFVGGEGDGGGVGEGNRDGNGDGNGDGKGNSNGNVEGNRQGEGEGYIVN